MEAGDPASIAFVPLWLAPGTASSAPSSRSFKIRGNSCFSEGTNSHPNESLRPPVADSLSAHGVASRVLYAAILTYRQKCTELL